MANARLVTGFGKPQKPQVSYQQYRVELKRRYAVTDDSELLLGTAIIRVPKTLYDPTGETLTKRTVWDCFAIGVCQCLLASKVADEKRVNAIWLFAANALPGTEPIERIETNPWQERGMECIDQGVLDDTKAAIAWKAFQLCEVEVQWLDVPVVA